MFKLGKRSLKNLDGLCPEGIVVVSTAIIWTEQDFSVLETLRTLKRQKELLESEDTWTLKSWHLKQKDGFAHAVDLGAYLNGKVRWPIHLYPAIADAMFEAAKHHGVYMEWGASKKLDKRGSFNKSNDMPHFQFPKFI